MKQDQTKIISCKDLGQLALPDFCPRCFWMERKLGKAPGIFPGIFSTLDSLTKKSTKRSFNLRKIQPEWLPLPDIAQPVEIPHISVPLPEIGGWVLTGVPDEIFQLNDGSYHVVDYKTARFTGKQDELLPMYETQLNGYAFALPYYGIKPVTRLSLIYCEPREELESDREFNLQFNIKTLDIDFKPEIISTLLIKARGILDSKYLPAPLPDCKKICSWVDSVMKKLNASV